MAYVTHRPISNLSNAELLTAYLAVERTMGKLAEQKLSVGVIMSQAEWIRAKDLDTKLYAEIKRRGLPLDFIGF